MYPRNSSGSSVFRRCSAARSRAEEDVPNGPKVAVISYQLFSRRFGGDLRLVGTPIQIAGEPTTLVGVLPATFKPDPPADIFIPLQADPNSTNQGHYLAVAGRLKPGVTLKAARAQMKVVGERFRRANPLWMDKTESVAVVPLQEAQVGDVKLPLMILLGAVGFVLLIACANVANLQLARASTRQREMAIRTAIGANRLRIVRQLLTESVVLALAGGVLGFLIGAVGCARTAGDRTGQSAAHQRQPAILRRRCPRSIGACSASPWPCPLPQASCSDCFRPCMSPGWM